MSDNVQLPVTGTGTADIVAATDDVASVHYPFVKLADGTLGSTEKIGGDAANGLDVDVTRLPALVAGTANIGDVDVLTIAAGDNNIGNVDIVTMPNVVIGSGTVTAVTNITNAVTVAQATAASLNMTEASAAAIKTSVELIDDSVATLGTTTYTETTTKGLTVGAVRRDADTTLVDTTNEIGPLQMNALGQLKVEVFSGETLPVSGTLTAVTDITNAVTVQQSNAANLEVFIRAADSENSGNPGDIKTDGDGNLYAKVIEIQNSGVATLGTDTYTEATTKGIIVGGVRRDADTTLVNTTNEIAPFQVDARGCVKVEVFSGGETLPVLDTNSAAALTAVQLIDDPVIADESAFTTATSKVMMSGVKTATTGTQPDDAGGADRAVSPLANRNRVPYVIGGDPAVLTLKHTTITTAVTDAAIITVAGSNKICVTRLTVTLDNASTVFPTLLIGFGAANTPTTTGVLAAHGGVPAGGGFTIGDGSGILGAGADGEDLRVTTTGNATGNGLQITVSYFLVVA